jgi:hypothetical protein
MDKIKGVFSRNDTEDSEETGIVDEVTKLNHLK